MNQALNGGIIDNPNLSFSLNGLNGPNQANNQKRNINKIEYKEMAHQHLDESLFSNNQRIQEDQDYRNQNAEGLDTENEWDYCNPKSMSMNQMIDFVLEKAKSKTNADVLCCTYWKFATQQKRKTTHLNHEIVTKCDYAANYRTDKVKDDEIDKKSHEKNLRSR